MGSPILFSKNTRIHLVKSLNQFKFLWIISLALFGSKAFSHPTSYEGGYALMSEVSTDHQELSIVYSPKYWLGLGIIGLRSPEEFDLVSTQLGWLVKRWNLPSAQANIYLVGGAGYGALYNLGVTKQKGLLVRYGIQADYENRRFFSFAKFVEHRLVKDHVLVTNQLMTAIGFAPYLADYDELNSWVIFKVALNDNFQTWNFSPTLRFFYKNFLWEIGQSLDGHTRINFMARM